mgnify:CR=1 FL=1
MQWEQMRPSDFEEFFADGNDMCLVPVGSMERHGPHIPVGNDTLKGHRWCVDAAERVGVVTTPPFYLTHVPPATTAPGALNLDIPTLLDYFEKVCDEIGRNGFRRIVLVSAHGGNNVWLPGLVKDMACKNKPYMTFCYYVPLLSRPEEDTELFSSAEAAGGHAGASESSIALHLFGDLVDEEAMRELEPAYEHRRPYDVTPAQAPYDFVASWPDLYHGNPAEATAQTGKRLYEHALEDLVALLQRIRDADIEEMMRMREELEACTRNPLGKDTGLEEK